MSKNKILTVILAACGIILLAGVVLALTGLFGSTLDVYDHAEMYTAGEAAVSGTVRCLDIDWSAGGVTFAWHDGDGILLSETSDREIGEDLRLRWWLDGDTLRVRFGKSGVRLSSLFGHYPQKELTVALPRGIEIAELDIDTGSASQHITGLNADTMKLDSASGRIEVQADWVGTLMADAASGSVSVSVGNAAAVTVSTASGGTDVTVEQANTLQVSTASGRIGVNAGSIGSLKLSSASGGISVEASSVDNGEIGSTSGAVRAQLDAFGSLKITTVSGAASAFLPVEPGYKAVLDTVSGRVVFNAPLTRSGNAYVCGDGSGQVTIETVSGGIQLDPLP